MEGHQMQRVALIRQTRGSVWVGLAVGACLYTALAPYARCGPIESAYSITEVPTVPTVPSPATPYVAGWREDAAGTWFGNEFVFSTMYDGGMLGTEPVKWSNGVLSPLAADTYGFVNDMNAAGQVVGDLEGPITNQPPTGTNDQAYLYSGGTLTMLGTFGARQSNALAISGNGQIAIGLQNANTTTAPESIIIDKNGAITPIPAPSPNASMGVTAINNAGQVLGSYLSPTTNASHAYLYSDGKTIDLGALVNSPNLMNNPIAMSSNGIVVGMSSTDTTWHGAMGAYIYYNGVMSAIPNYNGNEFIPSQVNAQGLVLGNIWLGNTNYESALYNSVTGSMELLNSLIPASASVGTLVASTIDDQGDIFASATVNGQTVSYELTPNEPGNVSPVPEPSTWLISIIMAGAVALRGYLRAVGPAPLPHRFPRLPVKLDPFFRNARLKCAFNCIPS
jgi:probable HAF family extracellular repeat protein